ncbi:unnamed protein product [Adineta ricciae]|uniref:Uncharacterized protein n=1 Tax=Adineta ricciae TaxID=249248 RepID=A0A815JIM3_ADIRI|nr:unnamed protein product [Adineta ricciae]
MISSFHLVLIIASCLLITHAYMDRQYVPLNDLDVYAIQNYGLNDDQTIVARRAAHFIFPPAALVSSSSSNRANDFRDILPNKRQSFGRKHHWDAFFGRRR